MPTTHRVGGIGFHALPVNIAGSNGEVMLVADANSLLKVVVDGLTLSTGKNLSAEQQEQYETYKEVQRLAELQKKRNVGDFAAYEEGLASGRRKLGYLPPVALWTPEPLEFEPSESGIGGTVFVPSDISLYPVDGDTQMNAWRELMNRTTRTDRKDWEQPNPMVKATLYWGQPQEWAQQAFHDANTKGVRVNVSQALAHDIMDAGTRITGLVIDRTGVQVDKQHRQLAKSSNKVFTLSTLRQGVLTSLLGMSGVQYGARSIGDRISPTDEKRLGPVVAAAWDAVLNEPVLAGMFRDREKYVISSPANVVAIGALIHRFLFEGDLEEEPGTPADVVAHLKSIEWRRKIDDTTFPWDGIIGKVVPNVDRDGNPKEGEEAFRFTIAAGPKEAGYQAFAAILEKQEQIKAAA